MDNIAELRSQFNNYAENDEIFEVLSSSAEEICTFESMEQLTNFFRTQLNVNPLPSWRLLHFLVSEKLTEKLECKKTFVDIARNSLKESIIAGGGSDETAIFNVLDSTVLMPILSRHEVSLLLNCKTVADKWENLFDETDIDDICDLHESRLLPKFESYIKFARLVMKLETFDELRSVSWWSELDEISEISSNCLFNVAYNELKRKREVLKFLHPYRHDGDVPVRLIVNSSEILRSLIDSGFEVSSENYKELRSLIVINEKLLKKQNPELALSSELDILNEKMISKIHYEMLQSDDFIHDQTSEIRRLLKMITSGEILLNTLISLLTVTENSESSKIIANVSNRSTDNVASSSSELRQKSSKNSLVRNSRTIKAILDSLRIFLMSFDQSDIYKLCDNVMKSKFDKVLKDVDTALWKLEIVAEKETKNEFKFGVQRSQNYSSFLDEESIHRTEYNSSDKEMGQKRKMPSKKNLRKRKRSSIKIGNDYDGSSSDYSNSDRVSNFPSTRLEMKPEELLKCCVVKCDYVNAGKIAEKFALRESRDAKQTKFLINFKNARDELLKLSREFSECARDKSVLDTTTDEIRRITEKGLIRQKFFQTLKNFIVHNRLKIQDNCREKSRLELTLNATAAIIFFLSIPCCYELTFDFYKYLLKTFKNDEWKSKLYLTDLMDIMTICSNEDIDTDIVGLLRTETFILDPDKFKSEIANRKKLLSIWSNDGESMSEVEKIQISTKLFDQLECRENLIARNLVNYVRQMKSVIRQVSGEELNFDDIAKVDPRDLLGKILFDLQFKPLMIDNLVNNSHVEMLEYAAVVGDRASEHVIDEDEKLLTLFQLREFSGGSADVDLNLDVNNVCEYDIQKLDLIYHLKSRNFFEFKNIISLSSLYGGNRILTALSYGHIDVRLLLKKLQESENLHEKLELLCSLSKQQWTRHHVQFDEIHDSYLEMIIDSSEKFEEKLEHLQKIRGIKHFYTQLMSFIDQIDDQELAVKLLIKCKKCSDELTADQLECAEKWINTVKIYSEICNDADEDTSWTKQKKEAEGNPYLVLEKLLMKKQNLPLCTEFMKICKVDIIDDHFKKIWIDILNEQETKESVIKLFKVLESCSDEDVTVMTISIFYAIDTIECLREALNYLATRLKYLSADQRILYQKYTISAKMCEMLENEYEDYFHLCAYPLLIIEQMLMNIELSKLTEILIEVRKLLSIDDYCFACDRSCNQIYEVREVITCDLDAFHSEMLITNECIDLMLKCYATKAIDFEVIEPTSSNGTSTIETSHSNFQMPREIPAKHEWTPDEAAKVCMCCQKQNFNLISRRHHCRRCGRVVCNDCSKHRVKLPEVYRDLSVRVCYDCNLWMSMRSTNNDEYSTEANSEVSYKTKDNLWRLTARDSTDQMIRDEFAYEESPSISLCLDIMDLHTHNDEIAKFLIFHCYRLEILLRPVRGRISSEVDVIMVAKMMKDLALAAKVHGDHGEANLIIDHADVIMKVVEYGCEYIVPSIPMEKMNSIAMRSIINDLIRSENWTVALELSVKFDNSGKIGVFSAWGVSALKHCRYSLARDKIALALNPISGSSPDLNRKFMQFLTKNEKQTQTFPYRRPNRGSPLLTEILEALENTARKTKFEEPQFIEDTIGVSIDTPVDVVISKIDPVEKEWENNEILESPYYTESMYYLIMYGGNEDILVFLKKNNLVPVALRYIQAQNISYDLFIIHVFVPLMKADKMNSLIRYLRKLDPRFVTWKNYLIQTCKYLEKKKAFNSLYQMQTNVGDRVRAALTCIDFYCEGVKSYSELHEKSFHLNEAKAHLLTELENVEWMSKENQQKTGKNELILKWDLKTINSTINIISLQLEIAKYLAECESNQLPTVDMMEKIFNEKKCVRTLFGKSQERNQVTILLLVCGKSIETGYGLAYRIIQECSLKASKVYSICAKFLARTLDRLMDVEKLISSIRANSSNEEEDTVKLCDDLISMSVEIAYDLFQSQAKAQVDHLIKLITSDDKKIECYITSNQLKTAYMKSAVINNQDYIGKIMRKAEATRQENIRRLCEKKLQQSSDSMSQCSKSDIQ